MKDVLARALATLSALEEKAMASVRQHRAEVENSNVYEDDVTQPYRQIREALIQLASNPTYDQLDTAGRVGYNAGLKAALDAMPAPLVIHAAAPFPGPAHGLWMCPHCAAEVRNMYHSCPNCHRRRT